MKLSEELQWRGFYKQATLEAPELLDDTHYTLYLGTDPSADSLHVGHLAVYMLVRRFIDRGHKVVLLVGGGTGVIGDPGGKTEERSLLSLDEIARNSEALAGQVTKLFNGQEFTLVNNYDWLHKVSVLDFLRDVGKHFSVGQLIQRDFISSRIGEGGTGISYAEFSYTLLQGYDFWHLYKNHGVNFQIGGSDQWGNILSGVELLRKKEGVEVHGMTAPLVINKSTGKKFGKSEGGAVWLDPAKTSVYQFYQFWLNVDDASVVEYLKLFTLLGKDEVGDIERRHAAEPEQRFGQKTLAAKVTDLVHGVERRESVERVIDVLFGGRKVSELTEHDITELSQEIPTVQAGVSIIEALVASGAATSKGEARRLLASGAVLIDGEKVSDDQLLPGRALIKKGKNSFVLVL